MRKFLLGEVVRLTSFTTAAMPAVPPTKILSAPTAAGEGQWLIYTGKVVRTCIPGLHPGPIDLVIDLATLSAETSEIPPTYEHEVGLGRWRDTAISGAGVVQRLARLDTPDDTRGLPMFDSARQVRATLAQKFPWPASIGAKPGPEGEWEIAAGPAEVNGQTLTPADVPLELG